MELDLDSRNQNRIELSIWMQDQNLVGMKQCWYSNIRFELIVETVAENKIAQIFPKSAEKKRNN